MEQTLELPRRTLRLHLHLEPRFGSGPCGTAIDGAQLRDRFLVYEGQSLGETFVYYSRRLSEIGARELVAQDGPAVDVLGHGSIDLKLRHWIFAAPTTPIECQLLAKRIVDDDPRILGHYGDFQIVASDGASLGQMLQFGRAST